MKILDSEPDPRASASTRLAEALMEHLGVDPRRVLNVSVDMTAGERPLRRQRVRVRWESHAYLTLADLAAATERAKDDNSNTQTSYTTGGPTG